MTALNYKHSNSFPSKATSRRRNLNAAARLNHVRKNLALSQEQLARLLRVSSRTVARWEKSESGPERHEQKQRLAHLQEIMDLGMKVYTPDGLKEFLNTPLPDFGNKTAYDMLFIGDFDAVMSALAADYEGTGA